MGAPNPNRTGISTGSQRIARLDQPFTVPSTTAETVAFTHTIPGGSLGSHGEIEYIGLVSVNNNANVKTVKAKFGGQIIHQAALASKLTGHFRKILANQNDEAVQVGSVVNVNDMGTISGVAVVALTVDTAADVVLQVTLQKANAGDVMTLEYLSVFLVK